MYKPHSAIGMFNKVMKLDLNTRGSSNESMIYQCLQQLILSTEPHRISLETHLFESLVLADGFKEPTVVEPVDPFQGGVLHVV